MILREKGMILPDGLTVQIRLYLREAQVKNFFKLLGQLKHTI